MVNSMTGFGRAELQDPEHKIVVEMKSVNHRYLDFSIKLPRRLNYLDALVRTVLKNYMNRGKVDVFIGCEDLAGADSSLQYNEALASQYVGYAARIEEQFGLQNDLTVSRLMHFQDILHQEASTFDEDALRTLLEKTVRMACEQFCESRAREGAVLCENLLDKLNSMKKTVKEIQTREPEIMELYKNRLREKIAELLGDANVDESRIAAEMVIFADKICTDEETVRLESHITAMEQALKGGDAVGRKLDFLAQEMNREANTILSKTNDMNTSNAAIELKTEIEKIREQIQNIE